jgi:hypothetical protein
MPFEAVLGHTGFVSDAEDAPEVTKVASGFVRFTGDFVKIVGAMPLLGCGQDQSPLRGWMSGVELQSQEVQEFKGSKPIALAIFSFCSLFLHLTLSFQERRQRGRRLVWSKQARDVYFLDL